MSTVPRALDSLGMLDAAARFPEQMLEAADQSRGLDNLPGRDEVEHVVILGMGGSAVAGEVLGAAAGPYLPVPVLVFRSYSVPAFVGEGSLVFAISFSGNTTTHDTVIRRQLLLVEDGVFNTEALKNSIKRVNQLGYFKPVEGGTFFAILGPAKMPSEPFRLVVGSGAADRPRSPRNFVQRARKLNCSAAR